MRFISAIAIMALTAAAAACGDQVAVPIPPTPIRLPAPAPAVSSAVLEISSLRATDMTPLGNGDFLYIVRFRLSELTGKSGATITDVETSTANSRSITGPGCWRGVVRVAPGETLDLFDTGWVPRSYCAPEVDSPAAVFPMSLVVRYMDDEGRAGTVAATVTVSR